jgi:YVTN family beta-propeller protein
MQVTGKRMLAWMLLLALTGCAANSINRPGLQADGSILLQNNWTLTPAGKQIPVGDLPLAMAVTPDDAYLLVTNNGYADQYVSVIDLSTEEEISRIPMQESWLGLTFNNGGERLYISGGGADEIEIHAFQAGSTSHERTLSIKAEGDEEPYFVAGLAISEQDDLLLACALRQNKLAVFNLADNAAPHYIDVGAYPYAVVIADSGDLAYVSNWGGQSISVVDLKSSAEIERIDVGSHPNAMVLSPKGNQLYVVNANSNELSIIDTANRQVHEVVDLSPYPGAPNGGSTPNGITISADGNTLYLVSADNNSVSVIDVSGTAAEIKGFIPAGWYPTDVKLTQHSQKLLIANGKGVSTSANPGGPQPTSSTGSLEYIGRLFLGTVSVLDVPDAAELEQFTRQVNANNGFDEMDAKLQLGEASIAPRAIPRRLGEPSLIKYVFYIIKENRTYDQVLGDMPQGEGDSNLALFGREVTPNHHALAEEFVLFDNFYVDAEVSADGHSWSLGAIATDFVEKLWPTNYSDRTFPMPLYFTDIAYPYAGYLWDVAKKTGVSYRSYGHYVRETENGLAPSVPALAGHISLRYPVLDLSVADNTRADIFIEELEDMIEKGEVPQLNILQLPNDHTMGLRPGAPTPRAMVADNDLALGRIVEAISKSSIWPESVVFIVQDDSQNGPDHIDAHRTPAFIASPYARREFVDHTMYDTVSMLRSIELILGLPPMSQYDAAAVPMHGAFQDTPDLRPYIYKPNTWPLDELNPAVGFGSDLSERMNFREVDAAPEELLNELIWKSIKGQDSEMPRPHSNRVWVELEDEDDDA